MAERRIRMLNNEDLKTLQDDKIKLRVENEQYLRSHPEITDIVSYFINQALLEEPTDVKLFASKLLSDENLKNIVAQFKDIREKEEKEPFL